MPIEIVWAPDSLLTDDAVASWLSRRTGAEVVRHNYLADPNLVDALTSASLFSDQRAAVVACPPKMDTEAAEALAAALGATDMDVMVTLVSERAPATVLKKLEAVGRVHKLEAPKRWEVGKWVTARARKDGLKFDAKAAAALVELVGDDLRGLANALDQLRLRYGDKSVGEQEVRRQFDASAQPPVWDLFDAMLARDSAKAHRILGRLLGSGEDPMAILFAIASSVRALVKTKALGNPSDSEISKTVGCSPGRAKVLKRQAGTADLDWLFGVLDACALADYEMKGGATDGPDAGRVPPPEQILTVVVSS